MISDAELWMLSFYRTSEISGALFFGRVARTVGPGEVQLDLTRHFADEARHAWCWTECIERLGLKPAKVTGAYQDLYAAVAGVPANLMEVLAATQIFERRAISQYARHLRRPRLDPLIRRTLETIIADERWHLAWVRQALARLKPVYGAGAVDAALARYQATDRQVHAQSMAEHGAVAAALFEVSQPEEAHACHRQPAEPGLALSDQAAR
jgi:hypothetical protein